MLLEGQVERPLTRVEMVAVRGRSTRSVCGTELPNTMPQRSFRPVNTRHTNLRLNNSGSLTIFAAIRRADSGITIKLSAAQLTARISLAAGPCRPVGPSPETPYESFRSGHRL